MDLAELPGLAPGETTSPWGRYERYLGYGVMALPFSSGDILALRVFPRTDFGGYVSVWHRDADGAWSQYVADAPVEAGCPRVWGPALDRAAPARIAIRWTGRTRLDVTMNDPALTWQLELHVTPMLAVLNAVHGRLPLWTWRFRPLVAAREQVARWLGLGSTSMSGRAPAGEQLVAALRRMYWISESSARLDGRDLGRPVVLDQCPTIGDWPLPRRGVFAVGEAHATIGDPSEYRRLRDRPLPRRVEVLSDRFVNLLEDTDPSATVPATPAWTVRDVAAHMVTVVRRYAQGPRGEGAWVDDPSELPALNERLLRDEGPARMSELIARIRAETASLVEQIRGYGTDPPTFRFNGGERVRADDALGLLCGELLVHGHDVAEVSGRRWEISTPDVEAVFQGAEEVLPGFVNRARAAGHTAGYDIRVTGGARHRWRFADGELDCAADATKPVDCRVRGAPGTLLLVMYGRVPAWRAALTGRVWAWGRRPWLALSLAERFHNP